MWYPPPRDVRASSFPFSLSLPRCCFFSVKSLRALLTMSTLRPTALRLLRPSSSTTPLLPTSPSSLLTSAAYKPASALKAQQVRSIGTSPALSTVKGFASALLHGSEEAREEGKEQHSKVVGRNKFIHEFQKHKVLPQHVETYRKRIASYYAGIHDSPEFHARLTGSFEIVTGELDTFVHIWEYEGSAGFEQTKQAIRESRGHLETFNHELLPLLQSRTSQLNREFRFWQTSPPAEKGGIYELRTYQLKPGSLLEWEHEWRVGLEARLATGHYPVGAWFSQVGPLHQVHHMWQYDSLEARQERRAQSWQKDEWSQTVAKTSRLTTQMTSQLLKPLKFSPLR